MAETGKEKLTDRELVAAALADSSAYSRIVDRYQAPLMRYVKRLGCRSQDDAEDILQETFIKTYLNLNEFDADLKFSSWIYRIAHNETISFFRRMKVRPRPAMTDEELLMLEEVRDSRDAVIEADRKFDAALIRDAIEALDDKYREALTLRYLEEKSYEEISDILQKPLGTVATLINRAKNRLKQELADRMPAEGVWKPADSPTT